MTNSKIIILSAEVPVSNSTPEGVVQRITVTVDDELKEQWDQFMSRRGYSNRSEAFRDLLRDRIERDRLDELATSHCVGCLTYVYDHGERELPRRLVQTQHAHHDLSLSTLHLHLDHHNCMEAVIVRGATSEVRAFAGTVISQPGVRHGHLWLVPVELDHTPHHHGDAEASDTPHVHTRLAT